MSTLNQKKFNVTVTTNGRITIPADIRRALNIVPGYRGELVLNGKGGMSFTKSPEERNNIIGRPAHLARNQTVPIDEDANHAVELEIYEQDLRSKNLT